MLLEDFINRHRNANRNPLVFPHVIIPILMIAGLAIFVVGFGLSLVCSFMNLMESIFNPKFALMSTLAGLGLTVGGLFIGALWGLLKERWSGFRRSNFETLILMYILLLSLSLPFPVLIIGKFFYHYPVVWYPAYEMVVKPTPELEREIERFSPAKIKWHTPYDYSLDKQVIRYEFLEWGFNDSLLYNIANKDPRFVNAYIPSNKARAFLKSIHPDSEHYPIVIEHDDKLVCSIKIRYSEKLNELETLEFEPLIKLKPIARADQYSAYYDMSLIYDVSTNFQNEKSCYRKSLYGNEEGKLLKYFWMKVLMLPQANENAFNYRRAGYHYIVDFSFSNFLNALDKLS